MDDYKITVGVEPTDNYQKAKQDLLQALQSIHSLTPVQRQQLAEELFGAANVSAIYQLLQHYWG